MTDLLSAAHGWLDSMDPRTPQEGIDAEILTDLITVVEKHPLDVQAWLAEEFGEYTSEAYADRFPNGARS
jgi:hypothetical protein